VGKLRHFAMSVSDPWKTAEFYKYAFGMEVVGETDSSLAEGVFLSDGVINLALLHFKSDEAAQGTGRDHVGLHHFGVWVDDPEAAQQRVEEAGARARAKICRAACRRCCGNGGAYAKGIAGFR
jgi:catechol 2,3-dioxygenase-like lactoylglutathione lyase family enzyme